MAKVECYYDCPIKMPDGTRPCGRGVVTLMRGANCSKNIAEAFSFQRVFQVQQSKTEPETTAVVIGTSGPIGTVVSGEIVRQQE